MTMKNLMFLSILLITLTGLTTAAPTDSTLVKQGQTLFNTKGCVACHTLTDRRLVGPGLQGLFDRLEAAEKDEEWLATYLKNPPVMVAKDPYLKKLHRIYQVIMPNLGLKEKEIQALIAYLKVVTQVKPASPQGKDTQNLDKK